jgi:hypothetical protein
MMADRPQKIIMGERYRSIAAASIRESVDRPLKPSEMMTGAPIDKTAASVKRITPDQLSTWDAIFSGLPDSDRYRTKTGIKTAVKVEEKTLFSSEGRAMAA